MTELVSVYDVLSVQFDVTVKLLGVTVSPIAIGCLGVMEIEEQCG